MTNMKTINTLKKYQKEYEKNGFVLIKNFIDKSKCVKALKWLNSKNKKKLAKSWTELEPGVDLAVYFIIHQGNSPVSELVNNKKVLNFASQLVKDKVYIYSSKVNLKSLNSKNNNFCFKLYNKKQEFLGGLLKLSKLACDSKYTIDKNGDWKKTLLSP